MTISKNIFEKINSNLPLGTVFIIVFGYIKLKLYYLIFFDIDINHYLNTTDIVNLVLGDVIYLGFIIAIPFFSFLKEEGKKSEPNKNANNQIKGEVKCTSSKIMIEEIRSFNKQNCLPNIGSHTRKKNLRKYPFVVIPFLSILLILLCYLIINNKLPYYIIALYQPYSFVAAVLICISIPPKYLISKSYSLTVCLMSGIFYLCSSVFCDYYAIKNDETTLVIKLENSETKTTPDLKRIGSTDKYLILWNEKEQKPNYISNDKIVSIEEYGKPEVN